MQRDIFLGFCFCFLCFVLFLFCFVFLFKQSVFEYIASNNQCFQVILLIIDKHLTVTMIICTSYEQTFLTIGAVMSQTAICTEIEAMYVVDLVQILGECDPNVHEKYRDQVYDTFGLDFQPRSRYIVQTWEKSIVDETKTPIPCGETISTLL